MRMQTVTTIWVHDTLWSELPGSIRMHFRETERLAYVTGARLFKQAAARSEEPLLVSLFDVLDDDAPMRVYVESENAGVPFIWFGFNYDFDFVHHPQFRLSSVRKLPIPMPARLERIYAAFGGVRLSEYDCGGLVPPEKMASLDSITSTTPRQLESEARIDPSGFYGILSLGNGDYVCINGTGRCLFYDHERCAVIDASLDEALDNHLQELSRKEDIQEVLFGPNKARGR